MIYVTYTGIMWPKARIRTRGLKLRTGLGSGRRAEFDDRIEAYCRDELAWQQFHCVMTFLPIEHHHEVDTWQLVRWIWYRWPEIELFVPRVVQGEIEAVQLKPGDELRTGAFGVPEPIAGKAIEVHAALDLILTPLLGFDELGGRVGYGGGFYDRFFGVHPEAQRVGLGYECLLVPGGIATEDHDVRLQEVITEERVHKFDA